MVRLHTVCIWCTCCSQHGSHRSALPESSGCGGQLARMPVFSKGRPCAAIRISCLTAQSRGCLHRGPPPPIAEHVGCKTHSQRACASNSFHVCVSLEAVYSTRGVVLHTQAAANIALRGDVSGCPRGGACRVASFNRGVVVSERAAALGVPDLFGRFSWQPLWCQLTATVNYYEIVSLLCFRVLQSARRHASMSVAVS